MAKFQVSTAHGATTVDAERGLLVQGALQFFDGEMATVALFAPGAWNHAVREDAR